MKLKIKTYRNDWFEFTPTFGFNLSFSCASYYDDNPMIHIHFIWGNMFIKLKKFKTITDSFFSHNIISYNEYKTPCYGVYYHESVFWFMYGKDKVKSIRLPFYYDWIRTSYMKKDGTWLNETKNNKDVDYYNKQKWKDVLLIESHPYNYKLNNGNIQNRVANISVIEREWRMKIFKFTKLFNRTRKVIDIEFDDEVGEKTGSWKGGCLGCSYEILKGETPEQTLRRMEKERIFK